MQKFLSDAVEFFPILLQGVWLTIVVTIGSLALSTVLGLFWALMRVSGIGVLAGLSAGLINVIRGIPIIVLLFYLYFVMPDFGVALTALQASILGLGIAYSAYQSENFRAGIEAIDKGQIEAAQTIGMGWWLTMRRVVLPLASPARAVLWRPDGQIVLTICQDGTAQRWHAANGQPCGEPLAGKIYAAAWGGPGGNTLATAGFDGTQFNSHG